jgi:three-Cys-motif partner protein
MAGSGVTSTQRAGDFFCGSYPGVLLSPSAKKYPFDFSIAVEKDPARAQALESRLKSLGLSTNIIVIPKDINESIPEIMDAVSKEKTISYTIIDPEGYKGLYWSTIEPFLKLKGDLMLNWFEDDLWRVRGAALSIKTDAQTRETHIKRLNELIGTEAWADVTSASELTGLFESRLLSSVDDAIIREVVIPRSQGDFKLILLSDKIVEKQAEEWAQHVSKRINSIHGKDISKLLDAKAGRLPTLDDFLE